MQADLTGMLVANRTGRKIFAAVSPNFPPRCFNVARCHDSHSLPGDEAQAIGTPATADGKPPDSVTGAAPRGVAIGSAGLRPTGCAVQRAHIQRSFSEVVKSTKVLLTPTICTVIVTSPVAQAVPPELKGCRSADGMVSSLCRR